MSAEGYVKVHRSLLEWGWYTDIPTRVLFDHLLLVVNWKPGMFLGQSIAPGSVVTSHGKLAQETGLTEKQVRRALGNLESTGEISIGRAGRGQLVSLENWAKYQGDDETGAASGQAKGSFRAASGQAKGNYRRREEGKEGKNNSPNGELQLPQPDPKGIDERKAEFQKRCADIVAETPGRLDPKERKAFFDYWTEPEKSGKRMRFEAEKFFDLGRRMDTWTANANRKSAPRPTGPVPAQRGDLQLTLE